MDMIMGVGVVDGLDIIPDKQHSYTMEYAVPSMGFVCDGAWDTLWDINKGLEEDPSEVVMTEVVKTEVVKTEVLKTEVLPAIFSKVDQFCNEMPSEGSMSETAVVVEEKQNMVSLNIEANIHDGAEYVVHAELGQRDAACEDTLSAAAECLYYR